MVDLSAIKGLSPDYWQHATPPERAEALRQFEREQAAEQGRDPCKVVFEHYEAEDDSPEIRGGFSRPDNTIYITRELLDHDAPHASVETVAHEGRHAYQWDVVQRPGEHPEASENRVNNWTYNFENYVRPKDDFEAYESQFVEVDANRHAATVVAQLPPEQEYAATDVDPERKALAAEGRNTMPSDSVEQVTPAPEAALRKPNLASDNLPAPEPPSSAERIALLDEGLSLMPPPPPPAPEPSTSPSVGMRA